ncbi:MAG TPA: DUF4254 domain-containing protein [Acidisarcina sp.]
MLSATTIKSIQDEYTALWHDQESPAPVAPSGADPLTQPVDFTRVVVEQHYSNFELWHAEDDARAPGATDHEIVRSKRLIDQVNQRRNDLAERCDLLLMNYLNARGLPISTAELHSETPGMMIDRLSILSLKLFHTAEQISRRDAPEGHAERNRERHRILLDQRDSLAGCLDALWMHVLAGQRRIQLYLQLKMYNDPSLGPVRHNTRNAR